MTNMTLAIPEDLRKLMRKHKSVRWSEVAREAMRAHAKKLEMMNELLSESELTEADIEKIGRQVKQGMAKKHKL